MITPVITIRNSGTKHQKPRTLCQFQSRANPFPAPKQRDLLQVGPIPFLRPPQKGLRSYQDEKGEVARSRNRASPRPGLAAHSQPAMQVPQPWRRISGARVILGPGFSRCKDLRTQCALGQNRTPLERQSPPVPSRWRAVVPAPPGLWRAGPPGAAAELLRWVAPESRGPLS
jgi:hypothetical protein